MSTHGIALQSGFVGDRIMVANIHSDKRMDATITGDMSLK
ncbi:hypothetical protein JCM19233_4335 [Vibrio astriarenae]|nr:hypothetical protein JCM19233_4335 [Vibrio sp. C7]